MEGEFEPPPEARNLHQRRSASVAELKDSVASLCEARDALLLRIRKMKTDLLVSIEEYDGELLDAVARSVSAAIESAARRVLAADESGVSTSEAAETAVKRAGAQADFGADIIAAVAGRVREREGRVFGVAPGDADLGDVERTIEQLEVAFDRWKKRQFYDAITAVEDERSAMMRSRRSSPPTANAMRQALARAALGEYLSSSAEDGGGEVADFSTSSADEQPTAGAKTAPRTGSRPPVNRLRLLQRKQLDDFFRAEERAVHDDFLTARRKAYHRAHSRGSRLDGASSSSIPGPPARPLTFLQAERVCQGLLADFWEKRRAQLWTKYLVAGRRVLGTTTALVTKQDFDRKFQVLETKLKKMMEER
eukprot:g1017.t1